MEKFDLLEKLTDVLGAEQVLDELVHALDTYTAMDCLKFIANNWDCGLDFDEDFDEE